jgi:hypothetical protein
LDRQSDFRKIRTVQTASQPAYSAATKLCGCAGSIVAPPRAECLSPPLGAPNALAAYCREARKSASVCRATRSASPGRHPLAKFRQIWKSMQAGDEGLQVIVLPGDTSRRHRRGRRNPGSAPSEETMNKDVDPQALSAAIAGFLACHVLTCRFLVQEGIVDRERFIAYLETAIDEMSPGIEDKRALFSLNRLVDGLRTAPAGKNLQ